MVFLERTKSKGLISHYEYECVDVFGEIKIKSRQRLSSEILDLIIMKALKDTPEGYMDGVRWKLNKQNEWDEVKETTYVWKINLNLNHFSLNLKKVWEFIKSTAKRLGGLFS